MGSVGAALPRRRALDADLAGDGARHASARVALEHIDAARHAHGLVDVVGNDDRRDAELGCHPAIPGADVGARQGVERREGLVEKRDVVAHQVGAQESRALTHAAGQLTRPFVLAAREPEALKERERLLAGSGLLLPGDHKRQNRVVEDGAARQQQVLLQHVAHEARASAEVLAVQEHDALARPREARERVEDGRLSAARLAHDADGLSRHHMQVDAADDIVHTVPGKREAARLERRRGDVRAGARGSDVGALLSHRAYAR